MPIDVLKHSEPSIACGKYRSQRSRRCSSLYFSYVGWLIAVVVAGTEINRIRLGEYGWMLTWQLVAVGATTLIFVMPAIARANAELTAKLPRLRMRIVLNEATERHPIRRSLRRIRPRLVIEIDAAGKRRRLNFSAQTLAASFGCAAFAVTALYLITLDHRRFVLVIALLEACTLYALRRDEWRLASPSICRFPSIQELQRHAFLLGIAATAILSWAMLSGLPYTHLGDWLLGSTSSALAMPAFVFAFGLVLTELADGPRDAVARSSKLTASAVFAAALALFAAYAFRTDNLLNDWVPLHRSYFADVAQFVRDGHHLLWDVPALYGFLSMLILAVIPAVNGWQAVYELTGIFLLIESCIVFAILRWGRTGLGNAAFAILFPLATIFGESLARYAWGPRLYPQGGLRFFWVINLVFVAFLMYVRRDDERSIRILRAIGHTLWCISLFWSVDNALWASIVWLPYALLDALTVPPVQASVASIIMRLGKRLWPLAALPLLEFASLQAWYRLRLGIVPDLRSYVDLLGRFTSGTIRAIFHLQPTGAAWAILIVLGAVGSLGIAAARERRWPLFRLLIAAWLSVWATASYYALEPLEEYVTLLLPVMITAASVAVFASREGLRHQATALFARISIAPIAIIAIAYAIGEPSHLVVMQLPFTRGWYFDVTQAFPPISGELAKLMRRAGIRPNDRVLVPNGPYWTELRQGMILPFTRLPDGKIVEYRSWLPTSPIGPEMLLNDLPPERRSTYIERFLDQSRSAGWYITYREPAKCDGLSPRLVSIRTYASTNFSASLCALKGG